MTTDFLIKVMQFALLPLASNALALDQYAELTFYMMLITATTPLLTMSAEAAYSVYFNLRNDDLDGNVFLATIVVGLLSSLFWCAIGAVVIQVASGSLQDAVLGSFEWILIAIYIIFDLIVRVEILGHRLGFRHMRFTMASVAYQSAKIVVALPLIFWFEDARVYVVAIVFVAVVSAIVLSYVSGKRPRYDPVTLKLVARYTVKVAPVSFMAVATNSVDRVIIVTLLGTVELAHYQSMLVLAGMVQVFVMALNKIYVPKLLLEYNINGYTFLQEKPRELRLHAFLWFAATVLAVLSGRPIFVLLFDEAVQFDFITYSMLCWNFSIFGFYFLWTNVLSLEERTVRLKSLGYGIAILPSIALSYMLAKSYGGMGAATAALLSNLFSSLILFFIVRKHFGKMYFFNEFVIYVVAACCVQGIALVWIA